MKRFALPLLAVLLGSVGVAFGVRGINADNGGGSGAPTSAQVTLSRPP